MTNYVYAERPTANTIYTVDPATLTLGPTIAIPLSPGAGINDTYAMTPDLSRLVVGVVGTVGGGVPSTIYEIDTASNTITHTYNLPGSQLLTGLVGGIPACASNNFAWFSARTTGTNAQVAIVDLTAHTLTMFSVPNVLVASFVNLAEMIITPDLSQLWVPARQPGGGGLGGMLVMDTLSTSPSTTFITIPLVGGHQSDCQQPIATADSQFVYTGEGDQNLTAYKFDTATKTLDGVSPISVPNPNNFNLGPTALDLTNTSYYNYQTSVAGPPFGLISVVNISTSAVTTNAPGIDNAGFGSRKTGNSTFSYFVATQPTGKIVIVPNAAPTTNTVITPPFAPGYCEVSTDGKKLWVSVPVAGSGIMVMDTTTNVITSIAFPTGLATTWNTAGNGTLVPPVSLHVGDLFIPRKGRSGGIGGGYEDQDLIIDFLAIENWANHSWSPAVTNLFLPAKPVGRPMTLAELDQNWRALEEWAGALGTVGGVAIRPLLVPRKGTLEEVDWDRDFWAIQTWANSLNP